MTAQAGSNVLLDDVFPIVAWCHPCPVKIGDRLMSDMAKAGFTVSILTTVDADIKEVLHALDVAQDNGVRLLLIHSSWLVRDGSVLDEARKRDIEKAVLRVKDHPGLYGYYLRDEPSFPLLDTLAEVTHFIRSIDDYHFCFINHFPPMRAWGALTMDHFWDHYIERASPELLSYDHYPVCVGTQSEVDARAGQPNVFPEEKLVLKPDYFECLEFMRTYSVRLRIPFWAFTCSYRGRLGHPTPTDGHLRFQLMNSLAYGASGLEYFTYSALLRPDGSATEAWEIARQINREIHTLAPVLRRLRSIGVFRTGPLWSGTRRFQASDGVYLGFDCDGDPVTIGTFVDPEGVLYLLIVNGNPCSWSRVNLKVREGKLCSVDPGDGALKPHSQDVCLSPGEGRLFQVTVPGSRPDGEGAKE